MDESKKRFEEWKRVECEDCDHWWNDSCDGVTEGVERRCTAFKATRRVVLPAKIEAVEKALEGLKRDLLILAILVGVLFGKLVMGLVR